MSDNMNNEKQHEIRALLFMLHSLRKLHGMVKNIAHELEKDTESKMN